MVDKIAEGRAQEIDRGLTPDRRDREELQTLSGETGPAGPGLSEMVSEVARAYRNVWQTKENQPIRKSVQIRESTGTSEDYLNHHISVGNAFVQRLDMLAGGLPILPADDPEPVIAALVEELRPRR